MIKLPKKFSDRVQAKLKPYQSVVTSHRSRDVSEADTVTVVKDVLADVFGYDKYSELTSEHQIRGTFCDLAIQIDGKIRFLIEVKGAGSTLSDAHLRQAVNYGAHQGIEWIILTNAVEWRFYKVLFAQPISWDEITRFNLADLNPRSQADLEKMFLLAREGLPSDAINAFHQHQQVVNHFTVAQLLLSDSIVGSVRRELRRLFPDLKVEVADIAEIMASGVLKREVVDGERVQDAKQRIKKAEQKLQRASRKSVETVAT
ncbi:MAG: restriction endonuclease subunit R [Pseudomonadota bacterium]